MDIPALATNLSQINTANSIDIAVAKKVLDAQKQQGDAAVQLLEAAAQTAQPSEPTHGGVLDVTG